MVILLPVVVDSCENLPYRALDDNWTESSSWASLKWNEILIQGTVIVGGEGDIHANGVM